jgi:geranylgeranyl diphosphate synthase, type II
MNNLENLLSIIEEQFVHHSDFMSGQPDELYAPIRYALSVGGKRLRPALVLMACNLFSDSVQSAIAPALALEVFHNFTLLHDDIMDKALVRRGQPTVHTKWNENTAILSGDAMLIKAYQLLGGCDAKLLPQLLSIFSQTAIEVCEGQQYDMNFETLDQVSESEYITMIRLKTSVLIAACCQMGALVGGASEKDAQLLYDFGVNLGIAFQLQDDYLDVYGNPLVFGKQIGGDIVSNKKTFLMIHALELAKSQILQTQSLSDSEKINAVTQIYTQHSIDTLTQNAINNYYQKALQSLDNVSISSERKIELQRFASQIMQRNK